jgi:hypothetical protein
VVGRAIFAIFLILIMLIVGSATLMLMLYALGLIGQ